jgi:formylglycine-generating enzyme
MKSVTTLALLAVLMLVGLSCSKKTAAGVVLVFETDSTLDPDTLHVTVTSGDKTLLDWCYAIETPSTFFPTTLAIASDGNAASSVTIQASLLRKGLTLDVRQNMVTQVPTDRVAELDIVFSARCTAQLSLLLGDPPHGADCTSGLASSLCVAGETCDPTTGMCLSGGVSGMSLPTYTPPDGGAHEPVSDGGDAMPDAPDTSEDAPEIGVQPPQPHCAPGGRGLTDCGASQESCCTSLEVTGGTFYRTYDLSPLMIDYDYFVAPDGNATGLSDPANVSSFDLDKYDVTVGRFRQFVNAWNGGAGFTPPLGSGKHTHLNGGRGLVDVGASADAGTAYEIGWTADEAADLAPTDTNLACEAHYATWTPAAGNNENRPINCVTWSEAEAFCIWDGGFLPSEAEWEYAAAGGKQQRPYPWGEPDPGTASQYAIYGCYYPLGPPGFMCTGVSNIAAVGTATPVGPYGQVDLAGNIYQWTSDWFADYVPCTDCANLMASYARVVRGGSYYEDLSTLLPPYRNFALPPVQRDKAIGFRCARSP